MAISANELRVAAKGGEDVLVFSLLPQGWISEDLEPVTFEFPTAVFEAMEMVPNSENTVREPLFQEPLRATSAVVN
jgi:hypothetical protein